MRTTARAPLRRRARMRAAGDCGAERSPRGAIFPLRTGPQGPAHEFDETHGRPESALPADSRERAGFQSNAHLPAARSTGNLRAREKRRGRLQFARAALPVRWRPVAPADAVIRPGRVRRDVYFALENDGWNCTFECEVHLSAKKAFGRPETWPVRSPGGVLAGPVRSSGRPLWPPSGGPHPRQGPAGGASLIGRAAVGVPARGPRGRSLSKSVAKAPIAPERRKRIVGIPRFFSRPIPARRAFATDLDKLRPGPSQESHASHRAGRRPTAASLNGE